MEETARGDGRAPVVYILSNHRSNGTYVGWTNNPQRRLRQHNGEIVGGARRTGVRAKAHEKGHWRFAAHLVGFRTPHEALSFEKYMHIRRNRKVGACRGRTAIESRFRKARKILQVYPDKFGHVRLVQLPLSSPPSDSSSSSSESSESRASFQ